MDDATIRTRLLVAQLLASLYPQPALAELTGLLQQLEEVVVRALSGFLSQLICPASSYELEQQLWDRTHEVLRQILAWTCNHLEPSIPAAVPARVEFKREYRLTYRRRIQSPNCVGTLFGEITLQRWLYEALEPGERCLFPLEIDLGVVARGATPAPAERVAWLSTSHTQEEVLHLLRREFHVSWSATTLRNVVAAVRDGLKPHLHEAQVQQVSAWLQKAADSRGRHKPLSGRTRAGRDTGAPGPGAWISSMPRSTCTTWRKCCSTISGRDTLGRGACATGSNTSLGPSIGCCIRRRSCVRT